MALTESLDLTPTNAPTPVGYSGASVADLPMPLLTKFSSQSDLVNITPVDTPMPFSPNHRTFRCFRVGGPARPVSLNRSAGPASQSHAHPPSSSRLAAAAPPHRRRTRIAPPRPRLARASPAPRLRRLLHALAAPVHLRSDYSTPRRRSSPSPTDSVTSIAPPTPLLWSFHRDSSPDLSSLHLWFKRAQGVRAFAPKGFSSIFVEYSSVILQGMIFTCVMFHFSYLSHMTTHDLCLSLTHIDS